MWNQFSGTKKAGVWVKRYFYLPHHTLLLARKTCFMPCMRDAQAVGYVSLTTEIELQCSSQNDSPLLNCWKFLFFILFLLIFSWFWGPLGRCSTAPATSPDPLGIFNLSITTKLLISFFYPSCVLLL